jgi:hypothetical protein
MNADLKVRDRRNLSSAPVLLQAGELAGVELRREVV